MITLQAIEEAKVAGKLIPFVPDPPWVSTPRAFLMTEHLDADIKAGCSPDDKKRRERWEKLRADIAHFVENGRITWKLMKWLDPKKFEHWELKSVRPSPSLRVFGRFAQPNVFVGTHVKERPLLKGKWSLEWEMEKLVCEEQWEEVFGDGKPFSGTTYEDYITENASKEIGVPP